MAIHTSNSTAMSSPSPFRFRMLPLSELYYGKFLTALINFLIVAFTLFVIIRTFEEMQERAVRRGEVTEEETKPDDVVLLTEIRDLLAEGRATPGGP